MPTLTDEASRSAGPPPVKKLKQIDPYDYAQSVPAGGYTLDMLRKTRPPPKAPKTVDLPGSNVDNVVEAWGTPRKSSRSGGLKVITLNNDTITKPKSQGGLWAEHRDKEETKSGRMNDMSLSLRSMDDSRPIGNWEELQQRGGGNNQTLSTSTRVLDKSSSLGVTSSSKYHTLSSPMIKTTKNNNSQAMTKYKNSSSVDFYGNDDDDFNSQDYSNDFMNDEGEGSVLTKSKNNKLVAPSSSSSSSSLPKLSLNNNKLSAEEKRANIPKGTIFERESPRAKSTLKSFLRNFMEDNGSVSVCVCVCLFVS
jgi:hypothetical protein